MLIIILFALVIWALVSVVVAGLCMDAARGDRALRTAAPASNDATSLRLVV